MIPPLQIEIADDAREQIAAAAVWWSENRLSAPDAIREELDRVLGLLSVQPEIGTKARCRRLCWVSRLAFRSALSPAEIELVFTCHTMKVNIAPTA